jgi:hypothetical protein
LKRREPRLRRATDTIPPIAHLQEALPMSISVFLRPVLSTIALLTLSLTLFACEAKITQDNYDKITVGMTRSQVEKILGGKGEDETASGTSITGAGIADSRGSKQSVFRWKDGSKHIVITFDKDEKVFAKTQQGL